MPLYLPQLAISEQHASSSTNRHLTGEPDLKPRTLAPAIRQIRAPTTVDGSQRSVTARNQRQRPEAPEPKPTSASTKAREQASTWLLDESRPRAGSNRYPATTSAPITHRKGVDVVLIERVAVVPPRHGRLLLLRRRGLRRGKGRGRAARGGGGRSPTSQRGGGDQLLRGCRFHF